MLKLIKILIDVFIWMKLFLDCLDNSCNFLANIRKRKRNRLPKNSNDQMNGKQRVNAFGLYYI
jgi:hypothetical protein